MEVMNAKNSFILCVLFLVSFTTCSQEKIPDADLQIAQAVSAAPEDSRNDATVLGYTTEGKLVTIREGSNSLICLSDNPDRDGFQSVCYHQDLEPFMTRGRELREEGKNFQEIFDIREKEAKEGSLQMPKDGATLHLLEGPEGYYDEKEAKVMNANYRYVVYIPWATAESTGLPLKPLVAGGPWIMDPGTHRAHIMITPPQE